MAVSLLRLSVTLPCLLPPPSLDLYLWSTSVPVLFLSPNHCPSLGVSEVDTLSSPRHWVPPVPCPPEFRSLYTPGVPHYLCLPCPSTRVPGRGGGDGPCDNVKITGSSRLFTSSFPSSSPLGRSTRSDTLPHSLYTPLSRDLWVLRPSEVSVSVFVSASGLPNTLLLGSLVPSLGPRSVSLWVCLFLWPLQSVCLLSPSLTDCPCPIEESDYFYKILTSPLPTD